MVCAEGNSSGTQEIRKKAGAVSYKERKGRKELLMGGAAALVGRCGFVMFEGALAALGMTRRGGESFCYWALQGDFAKLAGKEPPRGKAVLRLVCEREWQTF